MWKEQYILWADDRAIRYAMCKHCVWVKKHWPSSLAVGPESGFGISHMSATGYLQNVSWAEQILQGTYFVSFPLYPYLTESTAKRGKVT